MLRVTIRILAVVALLISGMITTTTGLAMTRAEDTTTVICGFLLASVSAAIYLFMSFQIGALWTDLRNLYKPKQPQ